MSKNELPTHGYGSTLDAEPSTPLHQQLAQLLDQLKWNLPRQMVFDTSAEYAADVGVIFVGEPSPPGAYEPSVTPAMGYTIAQQMELAAIYISLKTFPCIMLLAQEHPTTHESTLTL
jgi:hypothetical protein